MATPRQASGIPVFDSIEEEAEFWDSHDSTDFEDEFEPVDFEIAPDVRSHFIITVEFDRPVWNQLRDFARGQDMRLSDLARAWILEGFARATSSNSKELPPSSGAPSD